MLLWIGAVLLVGVVVMVIYDLVQTRHAILRNFPVLGHLRYWLEAVGPELRQYIVTGNDEERPFSRDQRRWVYASAKVQNPYFGFGTDNDLEASANYLILKHSSFPKTTPRKGDEDYDPSFEVPCRKWMGAAREREHSFLPGSIVNISGMSFGSLSGPAVEALNRGAALCGCLHNTGEGGVSSHHKKGGDLIWQIGTGYFGCRAADGGFDRDRLVETVEGADVKAIEIKLSQGAKPGLGGVLPKAKITPEIAGIRGIALGRDCISPARHSAFSDVDSMLDFVEDVADVTGLPVGIKSAVGEEKFWVELAEAMAKGDRGVDFVTIDGGEGGTGAGPLAFTDHVALPFKVGFSRVYRIFAEREIEDRVLFIGSGKLGFPEEGLLAMAMGCDAVNVGREAMMAIGCIQAQRCHTDHCPTGVATQNRWLARGLDPTSKAVRLASYVTALRKEMLLLARACGVDHPCEVGLDRFEILDDRYGTRPAAEIFGYVQAPLPPRPYDPEEDIVTVRLKTQRLP